MDETKSRVAPILMGTSLLLMLPVLAMALAGSAPRLRGVGASRYEMLEMRGGFDAPDFPDHVRWLNTDRPLGLKDLRGKVVLLDFWAADDAGRSRPGLERLIERYPRELAVIGVQADEFTFKRDTTRLERQIARHDIRYPVIHDSFLAVSRAYGTLGRPTTVLIDPAGRIVSVRRQPDAAAELGADIAALIAAFDSRGQIDRGPVAPQIARR
jgi:peroxiredoxin